MLWPLIEELIRAYPIFAYFIGCGVIFAFALFIAEIT